MKDGKLPAPNTIHPIVGYENEIYVKPMVTNPNIIVGDFTYIADREFESHVTHLYDWNGDLPLKGDTIIGNDVWIGQNATILPGVHIGDGAIIGANATVAGDIPPSFPSRRLRRNRSRSAGDHS